LKHRGLGGQRLARGRRDRRDSRLALGRPVCPAPRAQIHETVAASEHVIVARWRVLGFLAADDTNEAWIGAVVPPCEYRAAGVAVIQVAILGFKFFAAVLVSVSVVDDEALLKRRLFGIIDIAGYPMLLQIA
jgi:hypothetical protein